MVQIAATTDAPGKFVYPKVKLLMADCTCTFHRLSLVLELPAEEGRVRANQIFLDREEFEVGTDVETRDLSTVPFLN
jgi:hypothetical protein